MMPHGCGRLAGLHSERISSRLQPQYACFYTVSYRSMRDGDRSPADAAREGSEHSHLNLWMRRIPGRSCYTSGIIVETVPDIPGPKPNITHAGRVCHELWVRAMRLSVAPARPMLSRELDYGPTVRRPGGV